MSSNVNNMNNILINYTFLGISAAFCLLQFIFSDNEKVIDAFLAYNYLLFILSVVITMAFPLISMAKEPNKSLPQIAPYAVFVFIYVLIYLMCPDKIAPEDIAFFNKFFITVNISNNITAFLVVIYLLIFASILTFIYDGISGILKK